MAEGRLLYRKLAVFGASGPSGQEVVKQALAKGHSVTAVVRSPDKFTMRYFRLGLREHLVIEITAYDSSTNVHGVEVRLVTSFT